MEFTCTQKYLLDQMTEKYSSGGFSDYNTINMVNLFIAMNINGATHEEFEVMCENFEEFKAIREKIRGHIHKIAKKMKKIES